MKNTFKQSLILLFLTSIILPTWAADSKERWFQVELLIFKQPQIETDDPEVWPQYAEIEKPENFLELETKNDPAELNLVTNEQAPTDTTNFPAEIIVEDTKNLKPFAVLPDSEQRLRNHYLQLKKDPNYSVLFHEVWNEPVPGRDDVVPIRIGAGEMFGRKAELQGYISLYVERYLHLSTNLHLVQYEKSRDPFSFVEESDSGFSALQTLNDFGGLSLINTDSFNNNQIARESKNFYVAIESAHLEESRRMRSKHIHYLDNPKFGLLVLITPIKSQADVN